MATTTYFENNAVSNIEELYAQIRSILTGSGWTEQVIDGRISGAALSGGFGSRSVFRSNGDGVEVGGHYVEIARALDSNGSAPSIYVNTYTGIGSAGFVPVVTVDRSSSPSGQQVVTTSVPHGLQVGDMVAVGGHLDQTYNSSGGGTIGSQTAVISVGSPTEFTCGYSTSGGAPSTNSTTGGFAWKVLNPAATLELGVNNFQRLAPLDQQMQIFGGCNELALNLLVMQGASRFPIYVGNLFRNAFSVDFSQTFITTADVVGTGAPQSIPVATQPAQIVVGQPFDIIDSEVGGVMARAQVTAIGTSTVTVDALPAGTTFRAGSVCGWDPQPAICLAQTSNFSASRLSAAVIRQCAHGNASRTWAQNVGNSADSLVSIAVQIASEVKSAANIHQGNYNSLITGNIVAHRSANPGGGQRGSLHSICGVLQAGQTDFNFLRLGGRDPQDIYKMISSFEATASSDHVAYGPNVPNSTPLGT